MTQGQLVRAARVREGLSQQKLGEIIGYKGRTAFHMIQQIEYDKCPVPLDKMRRLTTALRLPVDIFIP